VCRIAGDGAFRGLKKILTAEGAENAEKNDSKSRNSNKNTNDSANYSERQKKVGMVKKPELSRKSPHPPFVKGGQGEISGYPFARFRKTVAVMSTY
jgi:hypothetical protein